MTSPPLRLVLAGDTAFLHRISSREHWRVATTTSGGRYHPPPTRRWAPRSECGPAEHFLSFVGNKLTTERKCPARDRRGIRGVPSPWTGLHTNFIDLQDKEGASQFLIDRHAMISNSVEDPRLPSCLDMLTVENESRRSIVSC